MKIKTIKTNQYKGDTFRRIEINGFPIIGIFKNGKHWECDTNGRIFKTIDEAKKYAIQFYMDRQFFMV